jgi:TRAP transporter TAXI family solute receptor
VSAKWFQQVSWRDALVVGVPALALVALTFWIASRYLEPAPPDRLVMATGAAGGTYQRYGEQYRRYLEPFGVTLELRPSSGSVQNFAWLRDGKVDVAFVQGGEGQPAPADAKGEPPVVSLGALFYEAMWVFQASGGVPADRLVELKGKRLAVGVDGSGTQSLALHLLQESGIDAGNTKLLRIGGADLFKALDAGEVDAVFQVVGVEAPLLADLLRRRDLTLMSLVHAPAYAQRHGKITALTVPRGVVDIEADLPPRDVSIVAVTANLLARNEVHPSTAAMPGWPRPEHFRTRAGRTSRLPRRRSATTGRASLSCSVTCRTGRRTSWIAC